MKRLYQCREDDEEGVVIGLDKGSGSDRQACGTGLLGLGGVMRSD